MKLDTKIFQSKIARRIFLMFISCALLPVFCLSIVAYRNVTKQLHEQSIKRLQRSVKGYGMAVIERLVFLETGLKLLASSLRKASGGPFQAHFEDFNGSRNNRFKAVAVVGAEGKVHLPIFKTIIMTRKPTETEIKHIQNGYTAISVLNQEGVSPSILMMTSVDPKNVNEGYLIGEINTDYLWGINQGNLLPAKTEFCVLDESKNVLFSSISYPGSFYRQLVSNLRYSPSGHFEFSFESQKYLASFWTAFLKPQYICSGWTVVLNQSKADVLAPMSHFKTIFPPIVLMTFWVVLLLSIYSIRKNMVPIESLKKGTHRIAMKNFDSRVDVKSGDEFEELAMDFNEMAEQLNSQFKILEAKAEIDRAILSSLDAKIIVETIIHGIYEWFDCDSVAICLTDPNQGNIARIYSNSYGQRKELSENSLEFRPSDLETFNSNPEYLVVESDKNQLSFLSTLVGQGIESFLILPIFVKINLKAVITIGRSQTKSYDAEDIIHARQMADQVAVALSNATLLEEMDQLGWGTLKALARTVDAKSSWTAGHSTRVTNIALKIASALAISPKKLDDLHRAALLHDIGKVGIPLSILDKPGALDDEEYTMIKKHPLIGARILEPIRSYKDVLPIVLQHHERFDGKGYPSGLSGNEIDIGARILSVADVYDALKSDRPYRKGWALDRVVDLITEEAGRQFDPVVVEAFLAIMRQEQTRAA